MTITPKHVRTQLAASSTLLESISRRLPPAVHAAHLAMTDPIPSDKVKPAASPDADSIRAKGGHGDPTADAALRELAWNTKVLDAMEANLKALRDAVGGLASFCDDWAPILGERTRCHGGRTVDDWSDPNCTNWADTYTVTTGEERVRGDGLCSKCRSKRERWERQQAS
jgi:hypothetical protein